MHALLKASKQFKYSWLTVYLKQEFLFTFSLRQYWPLEFWSSVVALAQKLSLNKYILYLFSFFGILNTQHFVLNILLSISRNLITSHLSMCYIRICFKNLGGFGTYIFRYQYPSQEMGFQRCNVENLSPLIIVKCAMFRHEIRWDAMNSVLLCNKYSFSKLEIPICFESDCS